MHDVQSGLHKSTLLSRIKHGKYSTIHDMDFRAPRRGSLSEEDYDFDSDYDYRYTRPSNRSLRRGLDSDREEIEQEELPQQGTLGRMSSWIQHHANSHQSQLAATAVLSGAAVAGAIFGYQALKRQEAVRELKDSIPEINERHHAEKVSCRWLVGAIVTYSYYVG